MRECFRAGIWRGQMCLLSSVPHVMLNSILHVILSAAKHLMLMAMLLMSMRCFAALRMTVWNASGGAP